MIITFVLTTFGIIYIRDGLTNVGSFANQETKYTQIFYSAPIAVDNPIESIVEPFLPKLSIRYTFNPYHTYSYILIIILILMCTILSLKYKYESNSAVQTYLSRLILLSVSIVTLILVGAIGFFYSNAFYPNTWYEKVQKQVSFKILKPTYLPSGFEQTARFNVYDHTIPNNLNSSQPASKTKVRLVSSGYGSDNFKEDYNQTIGFVVLKQYEIPSNFEFEQMIDTQKNKLLDEKVDKVILHETKEATIISGKNRANAKDDTPGSNVIKIYFTTSDNTLINLSGVINKNYQEEDYIKMATSLR
ncbi:MAG: hypothetical protein M3Q44_02535 [bacterium]|nr:hypothetical protein [bacterium]